MSAAAFEQAPARARFPLWPAIVAAALGSTLLTLPRARAVWSAGEFYDSDDAMRAVQLRDWLAGQAWFDMSAHRVDPPFGVFMHWTRIVDVPLAALELVFGLFLSPETAERATRLAFPLICLIALLALAAWIARALQCEPEGSRSAAALDRAPRAAAFLAVWLIFLAAPAFGQFAPGRIDHHAPQIVLLLTTLGLVFKGLDPATPRALFVAAACMALSCAISLENLPFFIVLIAAVALLFVQEGARAKTRILCFALGLLIFFPLCLAAVVAPSRYWLFACDMVSAAQLCPVLLGAAGLGALALASPRLVTATDRAIGVGLVGAMALVAILLTAPQCFGHPLGVLDPLLRELWLSHVTEAKPLLVVADDPATLAATVAPILAGLAAALVLAFRAQGVACWRWAVLAATIVIGFAAALWQIRVVSSVTPLAMVALACAIAAATQNLGASALLRGLAAAVAALAVSPMGLALALHSDREAAPKPNGRACLESAALAPLAALAPARIAAPIDMGAHLLAFTPHSVFAAPYHRDNHGGRIVVDAFLAPPAEAEALLRAAGADLVVWCGGGETTTALQARGLAAALARGEAPAWLAEIPSPETPVRVFALRPAQ